MDKLSKIELISNISKQNEQLKRYESRLRDVVTAYKGLVREKEALEASLTALNKTENSADQGDSVATLSVTVSTLAAEKARMEEAFQNDKRLAREQHDKIVRDLQEQLDILSRERQSELDNVRAKLAFEIQETERKQAEHSLTIKDYQVKLNAERRSKEKLEDKFIITDSSGNLELEKRFRDLTNELEATQRKLNRAEARTLQTPHMLVQLQDEISQMKQSHTVVLREERIKAKKAEETAKRMCASQEERVATLEARLAELSETVGEYDRQRRHDRDVIQQLRDNISKNIVIDKQSDEPARRPSRTSVEEILRDKSDSRSAEFKSNESSGMSYIQELIDKIHTLKKDLIVINETMGNPVDIWSIFNISGSSAQNVHSMYRAELAALRTEYELYKRQFVQNNNSNTDTSYQQHVNNRNELERLRSHIKTLQDKVEILNQQMEETEKECELKLTEQQDLLKHELITHKEELSEYKSRVISLEQQLQSQRERYATLLGEREEEIRARHEKDGELKTENNSRHHDINGSLQEVSAPPHMLHYAHELARKDLEISVLRKDKHHIEGLLRDSMRDSTIQKEKFIQVRKSMREEIDRLLRIQSREGANLEYLKNVVLSYLLSADLYRKRHMLKAIAAVLHFTDSEIESTNKITL